MGYANIAENVASSFPDYLDAFQLSHDPFETSPADDLVFYAGGQREQLLDQVAHLSQFSASVVVVAGESGSGRTTLKDVLHIQLQDRYLLADIAAAELAAPQQVFAEIAAVLGYDDSGDASPGELMSAIRSGLRQLQHERSDTLLLLLDDAHLLSDAVLSALLSLLQVAEPEDELPFQVVMFGGLDLIGRLDGFGMVDILLHDVVLPPLTEEELADYLVFRLEAAGWDGELPFSEVEVERLYGISQGLPGAVHQSARELLIHKAAQTAESGRTPAPAVGLPLAHIFSLVVLLGVLLMGFFYKDSWLGSDDDVAAGSTPLANSVPTTSVTDGRLDSDTVPGRRPGTSISLPFEPESPASAAPVTVAPSSVPPVTRRAGDGDTQSVSPASTVVPVIADTTPVEPIDTAADRAAAPVAVSPPPAPASTVSNKATWSADESQLLSLPAGYFVLQIMASGSEAAVDTYLQAQKNRDALRVYTSRRVGKPWYVVVTGNYSTVEMARAGVESLPAEQKKAGPWPRKVSDVQAQIKEYRGI